MFGYMDNEFEAKFFPINKREFRKRLKGLGAKLIFRERTMRTVLGDKRHNHQLNCDYIRVRNEGNLIRLSVKIHAKKEGDLGDQKETHVEVSDFDKTVKVLERLGLRLTYYQEKRRETWELDGAEVVIDTWPGLDPIVEIEAGSEMKVKKIAKKIGLDWDKKIITEAANIFAEVYGLTIDEVLEKISHITFDNNPFKNMENALSK
ncbi:MAG: hypothetical protein ACD_13C00103G0011 [uncultured bacterium]|nr:MAG: hypothetical protein ACD_13C00103G0011 [uncultured bacterium]KKR54267.1 MAG: hypothetical protein UT88_C0001G0020 [Candidatus Woesebacteria bacterium GW2011_GWD2_40_19]HAU65572.1 hypothetical protein [Candidatus Woesebacteria bacterium]HCC09014.1 hypothetical protein [Candidatus Woesebacteria bacterium]